MWVYVGMRWGGIKHTLQNDNNNGIDELGRISGGKTSRARQEGRGRREEEGHSLYSRLSYHTILERQDL